MQRLAKDALSAPIAVARMGEGMRLADMGGGVGVGWGGDGVRLLRRGGGRGTYASHAPG